jgi:hypothetical protein
MNYGLDRPAAVVGTTAFGILSFGIELSILQLMA